MRVNVIFDTFLILVKLLIIILSIRAIGFIKTFCLYVAYTKLLEYIIYKIYKIKRLEAADRVFVRKDKSQRYNIITLLKIKDYDDKKIKNFVIEKIIRSFPKFRSVIEQRFLTYYWKEHPVGEVEKHIRKIRTVEVFDEEEMIRYMKSQINQYVDIFNSYPYEIHFIKFISNPMEGALLIKFDHCFTDGLGLVSLIGGIADNYHPEMYPRIMKKRKFPSVIKVLKDLISLPYVIYQHKKRTRSDSLLNPIKLAPSGESFVAFTKIYEFDKLSDVCKHLNVSFNEFMMANISAGFKQYFSKHFELGKIPNYIYASVPIGNTGIPSSIDQIQIKNLCSMVFLKIPLIDDAITDYSKIAFVLKESVGNVLHPYFNKSVNMFGMEFLPNFLFDWCSDQVTRDMDICISNLPGSKCSLLYAGCEITDIISVVNAGFIFSFCLILTYHNTLRIMTSFDKLLGIKPEDVVECIQNSIEKSISRTCKYN